MKELEMIKAFAELEGFKFSSNKPSYKKDLGLWCSIYSDNCYGWYNPLLPNALNCAARDKYQVKVCYRYRECLIWVESTWVKASFKDQSIDKAVIECILKSEGKWID